MKKILPLLLLCMLLPLCAGAISLDKVPNVHLTDSTRYVSDPSGILSASDMRALDSRIAEIWRGTSAEVAVVMVDEVDPSYTPEEFATKLFERWGIGKSDNDNGVLVLVSVNDRAAVIRTGYGVEGALPDAIAGRIIRNDMFPRFREGDYAGGTAAAVNSIGKFLSDPSVAGEILSKEKNNARASGESFDFFPLYLKCCFAASLLMLVLVIYNINRTRTLDDVSRWRALNPWMQTALIVGVATLGMGLVAYALLAWKMHRIRRHRRKCPHCGTRMKLVDEVHDNDFLTPSQDLEERLNSVDYDVWHCPECAQTEILPYVNRSSPYKECPRCHARALAVTDRRILREATTRREGEGVDISVCRNCGNRTEKKFKIEKKVDLDAVVTGAVIGSSMGGRGGGGFGGGFGGGSFGGGMTGGGGAGGRW